MRFYRFLTETQNRAITGEYGASSYLIYMMKSENDSSYIRLAYDQSYFDN